jgi:crotonobetainyl-CoA:carnitine CoA-transferase CaiB-like acyl-CoA transferase
VRAINPNIVMVSMPGWGVEGPYSGYVTLGSGLDSSAGHTAVRGYPDQPFEDVQQIYHSDATGALTLVFAVVAGLRRRERTGEGCFVDLSQVEALAWQLPGLLAEWTMNGHVPERLGNGDPHVVPHGCYRAGGGEAGDDAWVVIAAEDDAQWRGVASAAGHPEWAAQGHAWSSVVGRLRDREAVDAALAAYASGGTAERVAEDVQAAGGIAAPVISPWSVLSSPQHAATGWLESVSHPLAGEQIFPGFAWRVAPDAQTWDRYCGLVGEHNHEVLGELGYIAGEIADLERSGAIGDRYEA